MVWKCCQLELEQEQMKESRRHEENESEGTEMIKM